MTNSINQPKRYTVGRVMFTTIPGGWEAIDGYGIRRTGDGVFPSNVIAFDDELRDGITLRQYVESQVGLLREHLIEAEIEWLEPIEIQRADEILELVIRHLGTDRQAIYQRQIYARSGSLVSVISLTTKSDEMDSVKIHFLAIIAGLMVHSERENVLAEVIPL